VTKSPIILAVDTSDFDTARSWIDATRKSIDVYKLGLEFYLNFGSEGIAAIARESGASIFLDLKLHDIPNTVKKSVASVDHLHPRFLTVHASGGAAMVAAAVSSVSASSQTSITAVTVLTSLSDSDLADLGYATSSLETAVSMARVATKAGATSVVCSPLEIQAIRAAVSPSVEIITPGVRPADEAVTDDQVRTMTPAQAISAGANYLVIGRPITSRWSDGKAAMSARAAQLVASIYE
jgi:orotidine-5'-phosphate decarboxylase